VTQNTAISPKQYANIAQLLLEVWQKRSFCDTKFQVERAETFLLPTMNPSYSFAYERFPFHNRQGGIMELIAILIFRNEDSFLTKYC
jgi:hypothetical protein